MYIYSSEVFRMMQLILMFLMQHPKCHPRASPRPGGTKRAADRVPVQRTGERPSAQTVGKSFHRYQKDEGTNYFLGCVMCIIYIYKYVYHCIHIYIL